MSQDKRTELSVSSERAILIGVILPDSSADPRDPLGELTSLTQTAGATVVATLIQNRNHIDPSTYVGKGKAAEIKQLVDLHKANVVIFDNDMSPNQLRDLEEIIGIKILDRSELILDIFATRARTHEAQLQVALAQLEYTYPRLRHMWSHLERITGSGGAGVGARGPGEMQLEIDRRIVREKVSDLKHRIKEVQARKSREVIDRKKQHFTISLVGYTNAGKSTLFNTLTGESTLVEDKLFATLDTKTRRYHLGGAHSALVSDTVGFVRDLPHHLVASFKATLEEATHADMLLLLLDVSHPHAQLQLTTVIETLQAIGCGDIPTLLVLNKIDALKEIAETEKSHNPNKIENQKSKIENGPDDLAFWKSMFPDALPASAKNGEGVPELTATIRDQMLGQVMRARLALPLSDPKGITFIEKFSDVIERDYESTPNLVILEVEMSQRILDQLPNNVPTAKILSTSKSKTHRNWKCRTKPIKDLLPKALLDKHNTNDRANALNLPSNTGTRPTAGSGLSIGKKKINDTAPKPKPRLERRGL